MAYIDHSVKLKRLYSLYCLGIEQLPIYKNIFEFVESKISELEKFEMLHIKDSLFYMDKSGKCAMEYNKNTKTIWIEKDLSWGMFISKYRSDLNGYKTLISIMLEKYHYLKIIPEYIQHYAAATIIYKKVEDSYKLNKSTI